MADFNEVQNLFSYAIIILITIVAISLGANILQSIEDDAPNNIAYNLNETLTWAGNNTGINLANGDLVSGSEMVYNNGTKINRGSGAAANYSMDYAGGVITILNSSTEGSPAGQSEWITNAINVSYNRYYGSYAKNITRYGLRTQNTFAKWMPTIALVLIISVIIGILIMYLARRFT